MAIDFNRLDYLNELKEFKERRSLLAELDSKYYSLKHKTKTDRSTRAAAAEKIGMRYDGPTEDLSREDKDIITASLDDIGMYLDELSDEVDEMRYRIEGEYKKPIDKLLEELDPEEKEYVNSKDKDAVIKGFKLEVDDDEEIAEFDLNAYQESLVGNRLR